MSAELKITTANFDSGVKGGVALVGFWAAWCALCRMQCPIMEKVAEKFAGKAKR